MTFQPPPGPPSEPPPPPPPPGQWGPPPGGQPAFDPKSVNPLDWAILGLGFLIFIFSFFSYYSLDAGSFGSSSAGAWHFGHAAFIAWFAMVFSVLGAVALALELVVPQVKLPWPSRLVTLGFFALGTLLYIIAIFAHPKFFSVGPYSFGHGFSFWVSFVFSLGGTVLALMRAQQTNTALPGPLSNLPNIGAKGPQGGIGGGGYTPPPPPPPGPPPGPPPTP